MARRCRWASAGVLARRASATILLPVGRFCEGISISATISRSVTRPSGLTKVGLGASAQLLKTVAGTKGVACVPAAARDGAHEDVEQRGRKRSRTIGLAAPF